MANPERGEVDLDVNGRRYRLALGMAGLRAIQQAVSTPGHRVTLIDVAKGASAGDVEYLCAMVWGALQRHHPDVTLAGVDTLIDDLGGINAIPIVLDKINQLMLATTADPQDQAVLKKTVSAPRETPGPAAIGTPGASSTSKRAKSA